MNDLIGAIQVDIVLMNELGADVKDQAQRLMLQPPGPELDLPDCVGAPARRLMEKLGIKE